MYRDARGAYEAGAKCAVTNRELEATALFKAARKLEECLAAWETPGRGAQLDEALRYNLRLWTLFQCELLKPDHVMLPHLRANMLRLSAFVDRRTFELMAEPSLDRVRPLIEVNRNIAMGLSSPGSDRSSG
jgi:flagellar protein FlaF